jgi:thiosulfate/3-mercaptopyruvate sulfurtransferase
MGKFVADQKVCVVDASLPLVGTKTDMRAQYLECHIPGAMFFDIDDIADPNSALPHMIPSEEIFAEKVAALGISNDCKVVAYDQHGIYSAARAWWMFRCFGHDNVAVLDGGLPAWRAMGYPFGVKEEAPRAAEFTATFRPELVRSVERVLANVDSAGEQVVDARGAGRFDGTDEEPRKELRRGHIPGSLNVPYADIVADGCMVDSKVLADAFEAGGVDPSKPIVTSCGSGITACILALGLYLNGHEDAAIYDGSWTEWGGRDDTPIDT